MRGYDGGPQDNAAYTLDQVNAVLDYLGIETVSQSANEFLCFCPFHYNRDTPAFSISMDRGVYCCFNPSCESSGTLEQLVMRLRGMDRFPARRLILKKGSETQGSYADRMARAMEKPDPFIEFEPKGLVEKMRDDFWQDDFAQEYMRTKRHFDNETLRYFNIGYSQKLDMITVPFYDPNGMHVGFIGRSISGKEFHNSKNLPKKETLWNLHNAKHHESVIIVEASFDAMRVHQAGYPNVVALVGGHLSTQQTYLLNRHFNKIINMTDDDPPRYETPCKRCDRRGFASCAGHSPGRTLGGTIATTFRDKRVLWASYSEGIVYPTEPLDGYRTKAAKDVGDMTDQEIRECLKNAVSNFEYASWNRD